VGEPEKRRGARGTLSACGEAGGESEKKVFQMGFRPWNTDITRWPFSAENRIAAPVGENRGALKFIRRLEKKV